MKLDPRTKLLLLAFTSLTIFFVEITTIECLLVLFPFVLLTEFKKYKTAFKYTAFYFILLFLATFALPYLPTNLASIVFVFSVYLRKLIPSFMLASLLISTTKVSEFLAAISRLHLPKGFTIALSITLRYFPTMSEEYAYIKDAMKLRGVYSGFTSFIKNPITTMEYIYVPMLTSAAKISDEITQAAITRGIERTQKRTCITDISFCIYDGIVVLLYICLIIFSICLMRGVI